MGNKTVSNATPIAILNACAEAGVSPASLLSKSEIGTEIISKPNGRTAFKDVLQLWQDSYELTGDRMIGAKTATGIPFGTFNVIDFIMSSSRTPWESMSRLVTYYPLVNQGMKITLERSAKGGYLELGNPADTEVLPFQYVDFVFACVVTRIRFSTSFDCSPSEIQLTCARPSDPSGYHELFSAPVRFDQRVNRIVFDRDTLEMSQPNADPRLCELIGNHAQRLIEELPPEKDLLDELARIIRKDLAVRQADLNTSARKIGMSPRSLQRELRKRGLSHQKLLDQVRLEVASTLIQERDLRMEEIAFLVGYSEKSSFYRAFKNWTGKTPKEFSRQLAGFGNKTGADSH